MNTTRRSFLGAITAGFAALVAIAKGQEPPKSIAKIAEPIVTSGYSSRLTRNSGSSLMGLVSILKNEPDGQSMHYNWFERDGGSKESTSNLLK